MMTFPDLKRSPRANALVYSLGFIVVFIISLVLASVPVMMFPKNIPSLYYGIFGTAGAFLTAALFLRLKKEKFTSIGLVWERHTPLRFLTGTAIGIVLFGFVIGFVMLAGGGYFKTVAVTNYEQLLFSLLPVFPLAFMEEIGFRSYPVVKLQKAYGVWSVQIILAFAFAFYHILNGWGIAASFMGPFIWSFVFSLAAIWSKGIAMSTGIHFALNIMQHLAGMKDNGHSLFIIAYKNEATVISNTANQYAGITAHVLVLLVACIATRMYVKKYRQPV